MDRRYSLKLRDDRGSILLGGFVLVLVMTILGFGLFDLTVLESRLVIDRQGRTQACNASEAGLNRLWQDMGNGDGTNDFSQVYALSNPTNVYTNAGFNTNNGIYTYTVTKLESLAGPPLAVHARATGTSPPTVTSSTGVQCVIDAVFNQQFGIPFALTGTAANSGANSVTISGGSTLVDSFNSNTAPYTPATAGSNGDVFSNGNVTISSGTVKGDVAAVGTVTNGGTVTGTVTNSATPPVSVAPNPVAPCSPFSNGSGITGSFTYSNGNLSVSGGGTVTLANGTYCFANITLSGGSTLVVNGPVVVFLTGNNSSMSGGAVVNTTQKAADLQFLSSGTGGKITLSGGSQSFMTVYAPGTEVDLSGGSDFFGAIVGNSVKITGGTNIHLDEALNNTSSLQGGVVTIKRNSWTLVQN